MPHQTSNDALSPTLWRTCRALANHKRLELLQATFGSQRPLSVSELAASLDMPLPLTAVYLRLLNARGLLTAKRSGRWVRYSVGTDQSIPGNRELVAALRYTFRSDDNPTEKIFKWVTAFTHPRRIRIVKMLKENGRQSIATLQARTHYSVDALKRHLKKLNDRGLISSEDAYWELTTPRRRLPKTLILIACGNDQ